MLITFKAWLCWAHSECSSHSDWVWCYKSTESSHSWRSGDLSLSRRSSWNNCELYNTYTSLNIRYPKTPFNSALLVDTECLHCTPLILSRPLHTISARLASVRNACIFLLPVLTNTVRNPRIAITTITHCGFCYCVLLWAKGRDSHADKVSESESVNLAFRYSPVVYQESR